MGEKYETVELDYTIHKYSSYLLNYVPANIRVSKPTDQLSRWFTNVNTSSQYIMLKLNSPAIVERITFGKYIKAHVSDMKKFQILGGTDDKNMSELLTAGLRNDNTPESFGLRHRTKEGLYLPVTYIKILPLQSWGPAYNYSIWHVVLHGKNQEDLIQTTMDTIDLRKEEEAVRILLKHLRRRRYKDAFEALSRESGVRLEGATQARLWTALVEAGDYALAEQIIEQAGRDGEFEWYLSWQPYAPRWRQMSPCSEAVEHRLSCASPPPAPAPAPARAPLGERDCLSPHSFITRLLGRPTDQELPAAEGAGGPEAGEGRESPPPPHCRTKPGPRGGHQLVVDAATGTLYLFGGWNGTEDLDDLWAYSTADESWRLLCERSGDAGGPSPRSCHKMVFDPVQRRLYTLGRYLDNAQRLPENMKSDLYMFDVGSGRWSLVSGDTAAAGGPRLMFDHQMCLDPDTQTIYVFGGRVLPANTDEVVCPQYSGLYAYYIGADTWQLLLGEQDGGEGGEGAGGGWLQPRVGHSMLFHPVQRRLYIFAGQRNKEHLLDLWWFDVSTREYGALASAAACAPPAAGFTQRATLDPDTDEMFVLSGMSKEKDRRVYNTLWAFSLRRRTWACVYRNERVAPHEPRPRFAHQLVLDPVRKIHYLFGGNPGNQSAPRLRLDDLWALELARPSLDRVTSRARAALREARYRELAADPDPANAAAALEYLRKDVREVFDHSDPDQVDRFQKLATALFAGRPRAEESVCGLTPAASRRLARRRARAVPAHTSELARSLQAVLGAVETVPDPPQPFEDVAEPAPDTWDVCDAGDDDAPPGARWDVRAARVKLYDELCQYFRPSAVPPQADITQLVDL